MVTNFRRLSALLLAGLLALSLAACSGSSNESAVSSSSPQAESQPESSESSASSDAAESESSTVVDVPLNEDSPTAVYSSGLTDDGYFESVTAGDCVTLPDYRNMEAPEDVSTVTDEEYESELSSRLAEYAVEEQVTDRAVQDGDSVNIDYVGSIDGVEFSGGSTGGNGTDVIIGVTSYIDDFLEQLIGHMPGDTFDVNVTFPDPYPNNTDYSGKDAVFVTTINYINETVTPELTDDFVAEHWAETEGWSTVAEAEAGIRAELKTTAVGNYLWEEIQDAAEISEMPDAIYQYQVGVMKGYYQAIADQYGMELDDFLSQYLQLDDMDAVVAQNESALNTNAKASLIMQALCEEMNIKPSDGDIAAYFARTLGVDDYTEYQSEYGRPYLALLTREDMAKRLLGSRE